MSRPARLFTSAKTPSPVPYDSKIARLALVRATLDSEITSIEPADGVLGDCRNLGIVAIVGDESGVIHALRLVDHGSESLDSYGALPVIEFSRADIEAWRDVLGMVWGCRRRFISAGDQVRVLHVLAENGATPLIEVASAARGASDGVAVVLAMACRGLVGLDLDGPLGPDTRVRRCSVAP